MSAPKTRTKKHRPKHLPTPLEKELAQDPNYKWLTAAVRRAQTNLRRALTQGAWTLYLELEERVNARHLHVINEALKKTKPKSKKPI